jgi:subtilisin family serine protease
VYVLDSGIRATHTEFTGRIGNGTDTINDGQNGNDCDGHGTHVSGIIGGTTYGVAKNVTIHPVRVLNCEGISSGSSVISGIDWVTANRIFPAVANMSLGGGYSTAFNNAVANSSAQGITYVVAAGNESNDACDFSPASTPTAITVGSTTIGDSQSSFSNFGTCVDVFAPGSQILSAYKNSDTSAATASGTSMSAPHVAGAAARFLQNNPSASPLLVHNSIINLVILGQVRQTDSYMPM